MHFLAAVSLAASLIAPAPQPVAPAPIGSLVSAGHGIVLPTDASHLCRWFGIFCDR